jgi:hypothetical protein
MIKGKASRILLGFLVLVLLAIPLLAAACNGDDDDMTHTPTVTPTPTHTSTMTPALTPMPTLTQSPTISGVPILPDLEVGVGDLTKVVLYDLAWNEITSDEDRNPTYSFTVDRGSNYILVADYSNGPSLAALTPTVTGDLKQDITIDTEVAMSLIIATEQAFIDFRPGSLSKPLDDLLADANQAVANLNAFYEDRNTNRKADRIADAIYALTMDFFNRSAVIYTDYINEDIVRSYGGGLQGMRSLEEIVSDPLPPLNPHFVFTRYNYRNEVDFGMSDLETRRWDFMGASGMTPHIATGGNRIAYAGPTSTVMASTSEYILGLYVRDLGTDPSDARLMTPWNMDCFTPSWAPDQSKIAFAARYVSNPSSTRPPAWHPLNIFVMDVETREITQLTHDRELVFDRVEGSLNPSWSPDGKAIVFDHSIGGIGDTNPDARLEIVLVDDPDSRSIFLRGGEAGIWQPSGPRFSPDGSQILFTANVEDEEPIWDYAIVILPTDYFANGGQVRVLTNDGFEDSGPDWSYDGRFIMFSSDRGGEPGRMTDTSAYLKPFYVISAYTGELVEDLGDFANAGYYYGARFCATEAVMAAVAGTEKTITGEAIISGSDHRTSTTGNSDYNYYRETIPAANSIVDAYGSPAYNYGVTSWW